mmetsp:Transcript_7420/g.16331  ORF Transcript_7420/g.16331 Transcript_7420/m.16331 type:complete len:602 (+) Transcript_7420:185-1990(+)
MTALANSTSSSSSSWGFAVPVYFSVQDALHQPPSSQLAKLHLASRRGHSASAAAAAASAAAAAEWSKHPDDAARARFSKLCLSSSSFISSAAVAAGGLLSMPLVASKWWRRRPTAAAARSKKSSWQQHLPPFPPEVLEIDYSQYMKPARRYTSSDWLDSLKGLPHSRILRRIRKPLLAMTVSSFLVTVAHLKLGMPALGGRDAHTLLGSALSLLLVFRTNSAYQRFTEGRKIWNDILDVSRNLALSVSAYEKEMGQRAVTELSQLLQAFPVAMQLHVRHETDKMPERLRLIMSEPEDFEGSPSASEARAGKVSPSLPSRSTSMPVNSPLYLVAQMMQAIKDVPLDGESYTNRERVWFLSMVNKLSTTIGRCERLVQTPVPLSYARHTARFVSVWTLMLPFALVPVFRWATPMVILVVAWALFGILEIGHTIEDPFSRSIELKPIVEAVQFDTSFAMRKETPPSGFRNEWDAPPQQPPSFLNGESRSAGSGSGPSGVTPYALSEQQEVDSFRSAWSWTEPHLEQRIPQVKGCTISEINNRHYKGWSARYPGVSPGSRSRGYGSNGVTSDMAAKHCFGWLWATHQKATGESIPYDIGEWDTVV